MSVASPLRSEERPAIRAAPVRSTRRQRSVALLLFLAALLPGLYEFRHPDAYGFGYGFEMASIARTLVAEGTFGNPDLPAVTGPTAANPPLYPLILAGLIKLFGQDGAAYGAVLLNVLINAAIAVLLLPLSQLLYGARAPGVFAGLLWVAAMRLMPQWDTSCTIFSLILFALVTAGEGRGRWVAGGILGGLVTLLNPSCALVLAAWLGYLCLTRRMALRLAAGALLLAALSNIPWVVRNYRTFHAPVLRTNFGFTLYSSNNPCAQSSLYENSRSGCFQLTHPVASASEVRLLQSLGEVQYDRRRTADALQWIRSNPQRFWQLTRARFVEFWFTDPGIAPRFAYAIWIVTLLSIPGLVLMIRRREASALFIAAVWLLYPILYYVVVSCDRYRFPILWTSLLPAGYFLASLVSLKHNLRGV